MAQRRHILNHRELPPPRHQPAGLPHGRAPSPADDHHQPRRRTYAGELEASLDQHRLTEPLTPWFALRVALGHQAGVPRLPLTDLLAWELVLVVGIDQPDAGSA